MGNIIFFTFVAQRKNVDTYMIVSIRHNVLKSLFERGTSSGISREMKDFLLLWLSVIHAAKDLRDLSIAHVSILEKENDSYRLTVHGAGNFTFRLVDGEIQQLNYQQEPK
jgi:plasmid maintenance system killer protein